MLNKFLLCIFIILSFLGCSTFQKSKEIRPVAAEDVLFPDGKYMQNADAQIKTPAEDKNFDFNAVVKKSTSEISFYGYSDFGLTLFKIHQLQENPVELESSITEINKNKDFFIQIFKLVKQIFYLQLSNPNYKNHKINLKLAQVDATVEFLEFDQNKIPKKMIVRTENKSQITINTKDYTFTTGTDHH